MNWKLEMQIGEQKNKAKEKNKQKVFWGERNCWEALRSFKRKQALVAMTHVFTSQVLIFIMT